MKTILHETTPKPQVMTLGTNPMTVWMTRKVQLIIEPGDTIKKVAKEIRFYWNADHERAREIAAFWFSIGEGSHRKGWNDRALKNTSNDRRFQPTRAKSRRESRPSSPRSGGRGRSSLS